MKRKEEIINKLGVVYNLMRPLPDYFVRLLVRAYQRDARIVGRKQLVAVQDARLHGLRSQIFIVLIQERLNYIHGVFN